jgi:hypothetical protein
MSKRARFDIAYAQNFSKTQVGLEREKGTCQFGFEQFDKALILPLSEPILGSA